MILPLSALYFAAHAWFRALRFRSRTLRAGGRSLHLYEREGDGAGPPVLLVHGLGGNAYSFAPLLRACVRQSRRVVLVELPGHGRSPLGDEEQPATILECAQAASAALLELDAPAVVIGSSLGGAIALHLALALPERVAGVVGLNPAGAPLQGEERLAVLEAFRGGSAQAALELNRRLYRKPPRLGWLFARDLGRHWASRPVRRLTEELREDQPGIDPAGLAALAKPVLILWGDADRVLPASSVAYFRAHLGSAAVEVVPGSGHLPQLEHAAQVTARVERFLQELPR